MKRWKHSNYARYRLLKSFLVIFAGLLFAVSFCAIAPGCGSGEESDARGRLIIFHAGSLARPFSELEKIFEEDNPGISITRESSGSHVAIRKITDLGRRADIIASADESLLREIMHPDHIEWAMLFAADRIVIAYGDQSRYRDEITAENWFDILLRDDVHYGYSDPATAPAGVYTLLAWQLANHHYADKLDGRDIAALLKENCPDRFIRPMCTELLPLLQSEAVDYIFEFGAVAIQHHLQILELPAEINMGDHRLIQHYGKAEVTLPARRGEDTVVTGRPILYGIAIPKGARNTESAIKFIELLISLRGREALERNHLQAISPPLGFMIESMPESLRNHVEEMEY